MPERFPFPLLSRADTVEITRRRRGRNRALLAALVALVALFYLITLAKFGHHGLAG